LTLITSGSENGEQATSSNPLTVTVIASAAAPFQVLPLNSDEDESLDPLDAVFAQMNEDPLLS